MIEKVEIMLLPMIKELGIDIKYNSVKKLNSQSQEESETEDIMIGTPYSKL
jgi:hypothetical protein